MKENCHFDMRLSEDLLKKLVYISGVEGRSANNTLLLMLRNYIAYFERTKGKIDPARLKDLDISSFSSDKEG